MPDRINSFLAGTEFGGWTRNRLAGDASSRCYHRLTGPDGRSAILMDTPIDQSASLVSFLRIAAHLSAMGLCAPRIVLAEPDTGLLVIEDLGAMDFTKWLSKTPLDEPVLYAAAVDVLIAMQSGASPLGLTALTPGYAAGMIAPLTEWYAPDAPLLPLTLALQVALDSYAPLADRLALRDFHAENLIWRPHRQGTDRVGLLDFQDAVLAPPEYDLVSLLRDARRDVSEAVVDAMIDRFACGTGRSVDMVRAAMACLGVQRNLRILGIFARLARRDGKSRYLDLMPRVWGHVQRDLQHPALARLAVLVTQHIPAPR